MLVYARFNSYCFSSLQSPAKKSETVVEPQAAKRAESPPRLPLFARDPSEVRQPRPRCKATLRHRFTLLQPSKMWHFEMNIPKMDHSNLQKITKTTKKKVLISDAPPKIISRSPVNSGSSGDSSEESSEEGKVRS